MSEDDPLNPVPEEEEPLFPILKEDVPTSTVQHGVTFDFYLYTIKSLAASQIFMFDDSPYYSDYFNFIGKIIAYVNSAALEEVEFTITEIFQRNEADGDGDGGEVVVGDGDGEVVEGDEWKELSLCLKGVISSNGTSKDGVLDFLYDSYEVCWRNGDEVSLTEEPVIGATVTTTASSFIDPEELRVSDIEDIVNISVEAAQTPGMYELIAPLLIYTDIDTIYSSAPSVSSTVCGQSTLSLMATFIAYRDSIMEEIRSGALDLQSTTSIILPDMSEMITPGVIELAFSSGMYTVQDESTAAYGQESLQKVLNAINAEAKKRFFKWFTSLVKPTLNEILISWKGIRYIKNLFLMQWKSIIYSEFTSYANTPEDAELLQLKSRQWLLDSSEESYKWPYYMEDLMLYTKIDTEEKFNLLLEAAFIPEGFSR